MIKPAIEWTYFFTSSLSKVKDQKVGKRERLIGHGHHWPRVFRLNPFHLLLLRKAAGNLIIQHSLQHIPFSKMPFTTKFKYSLQLSIGQFGLISIDDHAGNIGRAVEKT